MEPSQPQPEPSHQPQPDPSQPSLLTTNISSYASKLRTRPTTLRAMAETWVNIEDDEDMMNEIVDDEILLMESNINNENLDDVDKYEDSEETVQLIASTEKTTKHVDVIEAFATIESYLAQNKLTNECQTSLSRVRYGVQTHRMKKPKKSPTLKSYFNTRKPN